MIMIVTIDLQNEFNTINNSNNIVDNYYLFLIIIQNFNIAYYKLK
jgi:hypothetical protein